MSHIQYSLGLPEAEHRKANFKLAQELCQQPTVHATLQRARLKDALHTYDTGPSIPRTKHSPCCWCCSLCSPRARPPCSGLYLGLPGDWCVKEDNTYDPTVVCSLAAPICDAGYSGKCVELPAQNTVSSSGTAEGEAGACIPRSMQGSPAMRMSS